MMPIKPLIATLAITAILWRGDLHAQSETDSGKAPFSFELYRTPQVALPYRQAVISQTATPERLIIYLHGGTSKGNDNKTQMNEPGIDSIAQYVSENNLNSVIIVPQCPANESWGGRLTEVLKSLVEDRMDAFNGIEDTYIFGGSMGGTGTWTMISKYSGFFSAAMPVAGNPSKCDVSNVAQTPLFTVMGTEDRIMGMDAVTDFTSQLEEHGAKYVFEVEDGWSHEDTCTKSYTEGRLNWVFSNTKHSDGSGLIPGNTGQRLVIETTYRTLSGILVENPSGGFYIMQQKYSDSSITTTKQHFR